MPEWGQSRELRQCAEALVYRLMRERAQAVRAKALYCKRPHHRADCRRSPETIVREVAGGRKIAHEAACKGVAGACWIDYLRQWKCGNGDDEIILQYQRPVLATFDDYR